MGEHRRPRGTHPSLALSLAATAAAFCAIASAALLLAPTPTLHAGGGGRAAPSLPGLAPQLSTGLGPTGMSLSISVTPGIICVSNNVACPTDQRSARVTMTAAAPSQLALSWPEVQVVFLLETTIYDGAYDGSDGTPGTEQCADSSLREPCEESNMIPFFVTNAGSVAANIAAANPRSNVSFGLVDFFPTSDTYDDTPFDTNALAYHVDIGTTVIAGNFEAAVRSSFQQNVLGGGWTMPDADYGDNYLHSDSITALYGALMGYGIDWLPNAHHVIVLIGSTAPRDPSYVQNYCVSASEAWRVACYGAEGPYSSGCEPSFDFGPGSSPSCEGWVTPDNGQPNGSIALLTRSAPACVDSLGGRCTIDVIDLWTTPTDPYSAGWPSSHDGGPGGAYVLQNSQRILEAGCDLASATNGTWDGPSYYSCPGGAVGDLGFVAYGTVGTPQTNNPTLFAAFRGVGFGPVTSDLVAGGANESMFHFVPFANVRPAGNLNPKTTCLTVYGPRADCPGPTTPNSTGAESLNWNWSEVPATNVIRTGDLWIASFNVVAVGPPYGLVPVDACTTSQCAAGGSGAVAGTWTAARYIDPITGGLIVQSFPLAALRIVYGPQPPSPTTPTPPGGGVPPPSSIPSIPLAGPPVPITTAPTSIATVSVQALGAGFLGAGFTRIAQKNRPVAVGQANSPASRGPPRRRPPPRPNVVRWA